MKILSYGIDGHDRLAASVQGGALEPAQAFGVLNGRPSFRQAILYSKGNIIATWLERNGAEAVLARPDHVVLRSVAQASGASGLLMSLHRALGRVEAVK